MNTLWNLLKRLLGFPQPGDDNETYVTMREFRDCAVAALATAAGVSYDEARRALWHWDLPFFLESPLLSNPWWLASAIASLGKSPVFADNLSDLSTKDIGKTILLMHDPRGGLWGFLNQHWIVWFGRTPSGDHLVSWGAKNHLSLKTNDELETMVNAGWPKRIIRLEN